MTMNRSKLALLTATSAALFAAAPAFAGTDATFSSISDDLQNWSEGTLGKALGIGALMVGLGAGIVKQSVMAAVVGLGVALTASYGPGIVDGVFTAGLQITTAI